MTTPFLLCLKTEKVANTVQKLDDYQVKHHHMRFQKPAYLDEELEPPTPEIPVHTDMTEEETDRFMRQKPKTKARG